MNSLLFIGKRMKKFLILLILILLSGCYEENGLNNETQIGNNINIQTDEDMSIVEFPISNNIALPESNFNAVYREGSFLLKDDMFADSKSVVVLINGEQLNEERFILSEGLYEIEYFNLVNNKRSNSMFEEILVIDESDENYVDVYPNIDMKNEDKVIMRKDEVDVSEVTCAVYIDGDDIYSCYEVNKADVVVGVVLKSSNIEIFEQGAIRVDLIVKYEADDLVVFKPTEVNKDIVKPIVILQKSANENIFIINPDGFNELFDSNKTRYLYHSSSKQLRKVIGAIFFSEDESQVLVVTDYGISQWPEFAIKEYQISMLRITQDGINLEFDMSQKNFGIANIEFKNDEQWSFQQGIARNSEWDRVDTNYILETVILKNDSDDWESELEDVGASLIEIQSEVVELFSEMNENSDVIASEEIRKVDNIIFLDYYNIVENELFLWFKGTYNDTQVYFNRKLRENEEPNYSKQSNRPSVDSIHFVTDVGVVDIDVNIESSNPTINSDFLGFGYYALVDNWDNHYWWFVNKKTGILKNLFGELVKSNDSSKIIVKYNNSDYMRHKRFISVYNLSEDSVISECVVESDERWTPINIRWVDADTIFFDVIFDYDIDNQSAEKSSFYLKYVDSQWTLIGNQDGRLFFKNQ